MSKSKINRRVVSALGVISLHRCFVASLFRCMLSVPRNFLILLISIYQKILSPDHSFWAKSFHLHGYCKYHPTCSEYTKQALRKYGCIKGILKGSYRILRCHPWAEGGVDLP